MRSIYGYTHLSYGPGRGSDQVPVHADEHGVLYRLATSTHPGRFAGQALSLRRGDLVTPAERCSCGGKLGERCPHLQPEDARIGCTGWRRTGADRRVLRGGESDAIPTLTGVPVWVTRGDGSRYAAYQVDSGVPALALRGGSGRLELVEATSLGRQPLTWEVAKEHPSHRALLAHWDGEERVEASTP